MFGINKWDYFKITRESTIWKEADEAVGGKWKVERFEAVEGEGSWQCRVGEYLDGSGTISMHLFPDDWSREELLEELEYQFLYRTKPEWVLHYLQSKKRNISSTIRDKFWDFQKKFNLGEFNSKENN